MKAQPDSCSAKLACRRLSDRSWEGSSFQSTCKVRQPQNRKACDRGALGPHIRSANRGFPGGSGGKVGFPKDSPLEPSGDRQALVLAVQLAAPWPVELHVRCPRITTPHRWAPLAQEPPADLQLPCWNAGHKTVPSLIVFATCLPLPFWPNWKLDPAASEAALRTGGMVEAA